MEKKRKEYAEFRFYEKPSKEPVLALMGENWVRKYGEDVDCLHFHNMVEVGFCNWGKGKMVLNKKEFDYSAGSFTFIPHNYLHTTNSEKTCRWSYLFFDMEEVVMDLYRSNPETGKQMLQNLSRKVYISSIGEERYLGGVIQMLLDQMEHKRNYYKETIRGLLQVIVMQFASHNEDTASDQLINDGSSKIMAALEYISFRYREDIRISELASCCHLSETHFRRIFQKCMGMTPVEYINLSRTQAACDLMRKGNGHMEEVAIKVGYQTMSTFNRNFHRIIGISPYQWKMQVDREIEKIENYHISAKKGW